MNAHDLGALVLIGLLVVWGIYGAIAYEREHRP